MPVPVITIAQMRQWEQAAWAAGRTEEAVIARVGQLVAQRALDLTGSGDRLLILAGKGHNGDDARCAEPHLRGREADVLRVEDPAEAMPALDAAIARRPAWIIDGLFGIGLNRPLASAWVQFIEQVNQSRVPVFAVDVPSGLNADTGAPMGAAIRAALTLTLGAPKRGLLAPEAWPLVGRLEVAAAIGLPPCPVASDFQWTLPDDFRDYPPPREVAGHKGAFGHLAILAGSTGYHGAAVLAARGAQRAQPGLITLCTLPEVYLPVASQLQSVMVHPWSPHWRLPESATAILFGPGLAAAEASAAFKEAAIELWRQSPLPALADASGLDWLPEGAVASQAIRVMTPHPGEAARLLKSTSAAVQADRPAALRELSRRYGDCWVILKGHQTLVGRSQGEVFVNPSGNPLMAQGGSGDLLAGYLGGLLAQPALQPDPLRLLRFGTWQHGQAGDRLTRQQPNWTVDELAGGLGGTPNQGGSESRL